MKSVIMQSLLAELKERWFLYQESHKEIFEKLDMWGISFYCGFDPTAESLHLGNFIGFMCAVHLMLRGNMYYALVWGATGMIGDPGWKDAERSFLSEEQLKKNEQAIEKQLATILVRLEEMTEKKLPFKTINNIDFYKNMSYLDFLREVGKYHTVNQMIAKDTVKKRIEDPNKSISYTEFSYMLLQAYDFYRLFSDESVSLQIWGQDQWGNLMTGIELIHKKTEKESYAFTWPLMTDSSGKKFWKSEGNALFLDKTKTSAYKIYQYFLNTSDEDIEKFLKILTLLSLDEIKKILDEHKKCPEDRYGQKILAYKVVEIIHWEKEAEKSANISEFLFGQNDKMDFIRWLNGEDFSDFYKEIGGVEYSGQSLFWLFVESGLEKSNSTARQTFQSWGLFINEKKVADAKYDFSSDFINDKFLLLRKGKKNYKIVIKK